MSDPGLKYADRVSPSHRAAMQAIGLLANLLGQHREQFETLLKAEQNMHDVGHILDPTLYRDMIYSDGFKHQLRLVRAAIAFLDEVEVVKRELRPEAGGEDRDG